MTTAADVSRGPGLDPCAGIGFDITEPIWSESVALFVTSADATEAVSLRLCRYPEAGTAWLWAHVFTTDGAWSYNVDHLPCAGSVTDVDAADATYAIDGATFTRSGPRDAATGGAVAVQVDAHPGADAPDEEGTTPVRIHGTFTPAGTGGGTLPGRSELLGQAEIAVELPDRTVTVAGAAQFHEQHQSNPRFVVPFTYASLRGPALSLVALVAPRASGGFAIHHDRAGVDAGEPRLVTFREARLSEPDDGAHRVELIAEDPADTLRGDARVVHSFTIPLYGRPWWGPLVTADLDGKPVSGSVNRWRFQPEAP